MRHLIVTAISTLDGYAAGEGGDVFVMPIDLGFDRYNLERMRAAEIMLFGANSFHGARQYWPARADDEAAPEVEREISRLHVSLDKVVISDGTDPAATAPWSQNTMVVRRADAHEKVAALKRQGGGDIVVFGSFTVWHDLLKAGLVDEIHLLVGPGVIGSGVRTFPEGFDQRMSLLDVRRLDDSQLVALRYAVAQHEPPSR